MGTKGAAYTRISEDKLGDFHGVTNQADELERLATVRDITITARYTDNDISAHSGKHRPGYTALMAAAAAGEFDVVLIYQTSRLWRNRSERARGIETLRKAAVSVIAARGPSLDCSTAQGRALAGLLGEFDTMESEIKGERQSLANAADARNGKRRTSGRRSFGYAPDKVTPDPAEGPAVAAAVAAINAGGSVAGVAREWAAKGLRPPQGGQRAWTRASVTSILKNPVIAGLSVYKGEIVAKGQWPPLVSEDAWRACTAILGNKSRKPSRGVTSLLGGIALCPCGNRAMSNVNHLGTHVYRCPSGSRRPGTGPHVARVAADIDLWVTEAVIMRLGRPDAVDLLPARQRVDVAALSAEANAIRARRADLGALFADGAIDRGALIAGTQKASAKLAGLEGKLAEAAQESAVGPLLAAGDVRAAWGKLDLSRQRAVIAAIMAVRLLSPGRGTRAFDPASVRIEWVNG